MLTFLLNAFQSGKIGTADKGTEMAYSDFMADAKVGRIADVLIQGQEITGHLTTGGETFKVIIPDGENAVDRIAETGVRITAKPAEGEKISAFSVLLSWFPMLLLIGVWIFFMRQMQGKGGGGAMGFGKSACENAD